MVDINILKIQFVNLRKLVKTDNSELRKRCRLVKRVVCVGKESKQEEQVYSTNLTFEITIEATI